MPFYLQIKMSFYLQIKRTSYLQIKMVFYPRNLQIDLPQNLYSKATNLNLETRLPWNKADLLPLTKNQIYLGTSTPDLETDLPEPLPPNQANSKVDLLRNPVMPCHAMLRFNPK